MSILVQNYCGLDLSTAAFVLGILGVFGSITSISLNICMLESDLYYKYVPLLTAFFGIKFFSCVALIVGTQKRKPYLLLPWLIFNVIAMILAVVALATAEYYRLIDPKYDWHVIVVVTVVIVAVWTYAWAAVYSLYHDIRRDSETSSTETSGTSKYPKIV